MFVRLESEQGLLRKVRNTFGVTRLVSFDGKPKALPDHLVSGLMKRCDDGGRLLSPKCLIKGDIVELSNGPFANFVANVECIESERRIWVLMEFMGQRAKLEISRDHLNLST